MQKIRKGTRLERGVRMFGGGESLIKREPMDIWSKDYTPIWSRKKTRKVQILTGRGCIMILSHVWSS